MAASSPWGSAMTRSSRPGTGSWSPRQPGAPEPGRPAAALPGRSADGDLEFRFGHPLRAHPAPDAPGPDRGDQLTGAGALRGVVEGAGRAAHGQHAAVDPGGGARARAGYPG